MCIIKLRIHMTTHGSAAVIPRASARQGGYMAKNSTVTLESTELAWLCEQIALVQKSGIPLPEGIDLLAESSDLPRLTQVLAKLAIEMRAMIPLSDAMETIGGFPMYLVQMTRIGEMSGHLDQIMSSLSLFYDRDARLRRKVRSSLLYPMILLVMMIAVIILLIVRVLPVFQQILTSFGGQMPPFSLVLMSFGRLLARHWFWLLPTLILAVIAVILWLRRSPSGRRLMDRARLSLPLVGPLYRKIYTSRFSMSMAYLLRSAIDFETALEMTEGIMDNSLVTSRVRECRERVSRGEDAFAALQETALFPRLFIRMLSLGNRTGDLDQVMYRIASQYEDEIDHRLTRLASVAEPLLVVILSLIVGAILLTVMLPLVEIMASIG